MARVTSVEPIASGAVALPPAACDRRPVYPDVCAAGGALLEEARDRPPADMAGGTQARPVRQPQHLVSRRDLAAPEQTPHASVRSPHEIHDRPALVDVGVEHAQAIDEQPFEERRAPCLKRHRAERVEQRRDGVSVRDSIEAPGRLEKRRVRRFEVSEEHLRVRDAELNPRPDLGICVHAQLQREIADVVRIGETRGPEQLIGPVEQRPEQLPRKSAPVAALGDEQLHDRLDELVFPAQRATCAGRERAHTGKAAQHHLAQNFWIGVPRPLGRRHGLEEGADVLGVAVKRENVDMFPGQVHAPRLRRRAILTGGAADGRWFAQGRSMTTAETVLERRVSAAARRNVILPTIFEIPGRRKAAAPDLWPRISEQILSLTRSASSSADVRGKLRAR